MKHTLVALMQDHPGVLTRVVSLFRRRGFNIVSLAVGRSAVAGVSQMTLVVEAGDVEQVVKQLYRLIEVLKVSDLTSDPAVERELALVRVHATPATRAEIVSLTEVFGAEVMDVGPSTMVVELAADPAKVDRLVELLRPYGVREMMRSGRIAMARQAPAGAPPRARTRRPERLPLAAAS
jgi:acetolactate synthase I/III small subunit